MRYSQMTEIDRQAEREGAAIRSGPKGQTRGRKAMKGSKPLSSLENPRYGGMIHKPKKEKYEVYWRKVGKKLIQDVRIVQ